MTAEVTSSRSGTSVEAAAGPNALDLSEMRIANATLYHAANTFPSPAT